MKNESGRNQKRENYQQMTFVKNQVDLRCELPANSILSKTLTFIKTAFMGTITLPRVLAYLAIALLAYVGLRFALRATHFFVLTEESYSPYFWPRASWLLLHLSAGMLALLIGPFQFIAAIRKKYVKVHRFMGKTYLICVLLGAIAAYYLAFTSQINIVYAGGLTSLATVWLTTGLMAFISIKKGRTNLHREWMVRSYVVTFGFVTFRLFDELLTNYYPSIPQPDRLALLSWTCWAIPLFFTEVILQARKLGKKPLIS